MTLNLHQLPDDILLDIFLRLTVLDVLSLKQVCSANFPNCYCYSRHVDMSNITHYRFIRIPVALRDRARSQSAFGNSA